MKKEDDISRGKMNPYARRLKKQITIRLDVPSIDISKGPADETGIPKTIALASMAEPSCGKNPQLSWSS